MPKDTCNHDNEGFWDELWIIIGVKKNLMKNINFYQILRVPLQQKNEMQVVDECYSTLDQRSYKKWESRGKSG